MLARHLLLALLAGATLCAARPAAALTFVVDTTVDAVDATPGDGLCRTAGGDCSLRAVTQEANASPAGTTITVTLPAGTYPLTLTGDFEDNSATGDLDVTLPSFAELTITGAGAGTTIIDGQGADRVLDVCLFGYACVGTPVVIQGVTITNGYSAGDGGGAIRSRGLLRIVDSVVSGSRADVTGGGGIYNRDTGTLELTHSTVQGNESNGSFGGGGVFNHLGAIAILTGSAVLDNVSNDSGGGGLTNFQAEYRIHSSTVSGNVGSNDGGGILNYGGFGSTQTRLENATVADNATFAGGGFAFGYGGGGVTNLYTGQVIFKNTIIADNADPIAGSSDCAGSPFNSQGYNLIESAAGCFILFGDATTQTNVDPQLGPRSTAGGTTETYPLLAGSPALDAGDPVAANCDPTDQRDVPRPRGPRCDVGAFEAVVCGDGNVDLGEVCDDGNTLGGDCCDATCQTQAGDGTPCSDGDVCTNFDQCMNGACVAQTGPSFLCYSPFTSNAGLLAIKMKGGTKDTLKWTWTHGGATMLGAFGDPTTGTPYTLCVYDRSGPAGASRIRLHAEAPAGGTCVGKPCWKAVGTKGFSYKDKGLDPNGLANIQLRAGADGKAKVTVTGKGALLAAPTLPLSPPVAVELYNTAGSCWNGPFSTPLLNTPTQFKAKAD